MNEALAELFEGARVPRYTSYPTVPHFSAAIGTSEHGAWLAELPVEKAISVYLHVPYCQELCWYCGCNTHVAGSQARVLAYGQLLERELDLQLDLLPGRATVSHLHWGGGTPSILGPERFSGLMARLRERLNFRQDAELAIELDPRTFDRSMASALAEAGINRVSLGVQSFERAVQQAIHRDQSFEVTAASVELLRGHGIDRINADLLYGLPLQTVANCEATVRQLLELEPARIAIFGYAHLPRLLKHQRLIDEAQLPSTKERLTQFEAMARLLVAAGYQAIGLDHFAKPDDSMAVAAREGRLRRNFQGYTTDPAEALLGFGASAISSLPTGYLQNHSDLKAYREDVRAGRLPTAKGIRLTARDRVERSIIEAVMCNGDVDLAAIAAAHAVPLGECLPRGRRLQELERHGVVHRAGTRWTVDEECWPLLRVVAAAFDSYLDGAAGRHAAAI